MIEALEITNIQCAEGAYPPNGNAPVTFREFGAERVTNRRILNWSPSMGSYGMGGPGFFGIQLEGDSTYPKEWFVLALWDSGGWLQLDGRDLRSQVNNKRLPCEPIWAITSRMLGPFSIMLLPLVVIVNFIRMLFRRSWDGVYRKIHRAVIVEVNITEETTKIIFKNRAKAIVLVSPNNISVPTTGAMLKIKANHRDAWLITTTGKLYI